MKLTKETRTTDSEMLFGNDNDKVTMGIDIEAMSHIIKRLTNLYSNPVEATVREVISNAIDTSKRLPLSDRKPVRIILPTQMNAEFKVIDQGEGMSYDVLSKVYTQYGASTKRDDMTQIGAHGLGAKAPLSYCSQFVVESTKDGERNTLVISSEEDGNYARFEDAVESDEPNGTVVTVPVSANDVSAFVKAAEIYFLYNIDNELELKFENHEYNSNLKSMVKLGSVQIDNESEFKVDVYGNSGSAQKTLRDYMKNRIQEHPSYLMSGWEYTPSSSNWRDVKWHVNLVPGLVDFDSSRDEITVNGRFKRIDELLTSKQDEIITEFINNEYKEGRLTKQEVYQEFIEYVTAYNPSTLVRGMAKMFEDNYGFNPMKDLLVRGTGREFVSAFSKRFSGGTSTSYAPFYSNDESHLDFSATSVHLAREAMTEKIIPVSFEEFVYASRDKNLVITELPKVKDGSSDERMRKIYNKSTAWGNSSNYYYDNVLFAGTELTEQEVKDNISKWVDDKRIKDAITFITYEDYMIATKPKRAVTKKDPEVSKIRAYITSPDKPRQITSNSYYNSPEYSEETDFSSNPKFNDPEYRKVVIFSQTVNSFPGARYVPNAMMNEYFKSGGKVVFAIIPLSSLSKAKYDYLCEKTTIMYAHDTIEANGKSLNEAIKNDCISLPKTAEVDLSNDDYSELFTNQFEEVTKFLYGGPNTDYMDKNKLNELKYFNEFSQGVRDSYYIAGRLDFNYINEDNVTEKNAVYRAAYDFALENQTVMRDLRISSKQVGYQKIITDHFISLFNDGKVIEDLHIVPTEGTEK